MYKNVFLNLHFNILGRKHPTTVTKIKSYLMMEHLEKLKFPANFGKDKIGEKHPTIPYQRNGFDCGPFLLHYVELIFRGKCQS